MRFADFILWFVAFFLVGLSQPSHAVGHINIGYPQGMFQYDNQLYLKHGDDVSKIYPDLDRSVNTSKTMQIPTSKGRVPVTITQKTPVLMPKVGKAAVIIAKRLGPVGIALTAREVMCAVSDICTSPDKPEEFQKRTDPSPPTEENPAITALFSYAGTATVIGLENVANLPTPQAVCSAISNQPSSGGIYVLVTQSANYPVGSYGKCVYTPNVNTNGFGVLVGRNVGCPSGYYQDGIQCRKNTAYQYAPLTPTDWDEAEPKLNVPELINPILDAGEPLPMDSPNPITEITKPLPSTSETIRDGSGTATGTRTSVPTLKIEPTSRPDVVKVSETTIITTTNITNNTTEITTIIESPPDESPPIEEEETDIEFDEVSDEDLQEHEIEEDFEKQDWGGGSCPANPVISTSKGSFELPFNNACDFAEMLRYVVLILSALTAAYIISGAKVGSD